MTAAPCNVYRLELITAFTLAIDGQRILPTEVRYKRDVCTTDDRTQLQTRSVFTVSLSKHGGFIIVKLSQSTKVISS